MSYAVRAPAAAPARAVFAVRPRQLRRLPAAAPVRRRALACRASAETGAEVADLLEGSSIFLVGMMGTGKSSVGKKLAASLGYNFFDTCVSPSPSPSPVPRSPIRPIRPAASPTHVPDSPRPRVPIPAATRSSSR